MPAERATEPDYGPAVTEIATHTLTLRPLLITTF